MRELGRPLLDTRCRLAVLQHVEIPASWQTILPLDKYLILVADLVGIHAD